MVLSPSSVISRSGSDLLAIKHVADDVTLSTAERMALIQRIVAGCGLILPDVLEESSGDTAGGIHNACPFG